MKGFHAYALVLTDIKYIYIYININMYINIICHLINQFVLTVYVLFINGRYYSKENIIKKIKKKENDID